MTTRKQRRVRSLLTRIGIVALLLGVAIGVYRVIWPPVKSPTDVAYEVGAHYGDVHPRIVAVESTSTDNIPHDPMYFMTIEGRFHKGRQIVRYVSFSALADRTYVWGVQGYNKAGSPDWSENELEPLPPL